MVGIWFNLSGWMEGRIGGETLFSWFSGAGCLRCFCRRDGAQTGRQAVWRWYQHGDQLGEAPAGDRERCAGPDGWSPAEGDFGRAPAVGFAADQGWRLHATWARGRAG